MSATKRALTYFREHQTYVVISLPLKSALMVSEKANATGMVSDIPIVSGLGPRDMRCDALANGACSKLATLDARSNGLVIAGLCRPGRGRDLKVDDEDGGGRMPPANPDAGRFSFKSGLSETETVVCKIRYFHSGVHKFSTKNVLFWASYRVLRCMSHRKIGRVCLTSDRTGQYYDASCKRPSVHNQHD